MAETIFRLLDLPTELLIQILALLDLDTLDAFRNTSALMRDLIADSVELQYLIACDIAQVVDNPTSKRPIYDRHKLLRAREKSFADMNPSWKCEVSVPFRPAGLYELSGGFFWLGENARTALRFLKLPLEPPGQDSPPLTWGRLALPNPRQQMIIDFGLGIEEHDLVVVASFSWDTPTPTTEGMVVLQFFSLSTQQAHPHAKGSIEVMKSSWGIPHVTLEIVGDNLLFLVSFSNPTAIVAAERGDGPKNTVYIYEWKTGALKMAIHAELHTYFGAVFLTPEVFMLPNTMTAALELWKIDPAQTAPTLTLHLPRLVPGARIRHMTARGEPNPAVYPCTRDPRVPFSPSVPDSIIIFHLTFPGQQTVLFVHRRALLAALASAPDDTLSLPYAEWGADACRWLSGRGLVMDWITTTAGQRCVLLPARLPTQFLILDFNMHPKRKRTPTGMSASDELMPHDDALEGTGLWAEPVGSRLPAVATIGRDKHFEYTGASMDDARIIAIKRDLLRQVHAVDIYYFG